MGYAVPVNVMSIILICMTWLLIDEEMNGYK